MSKQPTPSLAIRRWILILYWTLMFLATHWPDTDRLKPETGWPSPAFETVMHVGVYAGWVAMWWWMLSVRRRRVSAATINWLVLGGAVYAVFDEMTQAIVGRTPAIDDFIMDVAGLVAATVILQAWQKRRTTITR